MAVFPFPSILDDIKEKGFRKAIFETVDESVERLTAGMNIQDIRDALRGDEPRRPNPRLQPHADGFWLHMRPSYYNTSVTGIYPTFRLGWLSTYFFAIEIITGLFLMIFYTPSPEVAYQDMQNIMGNVPLGQFMRDLHRIGAEGMVLFVMLHLVRTYATGSYKKPRQFTWFTGVVLLLSTLFLSFSGYLLPWDQLAFWAVTIGTSMAEAAPPEIVGSNVNLLLRGAPDIGAGGLLRFYLLHVFALPLITIIFLGVHYYKVVLHGHSLPPRAEEIGTDTAKRVPTDRRSYFIPDVLSTETAWVGVVSFILVVLVTWFFHAPLENHADPQVTPLHTTAPWYFLWLQGMLKLGDKVLMGIIVPTIVFGVMFVWPYLDLTPSRRYADRRVALSFGAVIVLLFAVLQYMGTPFYAVETAANTEIAQDLIPQEGVGPVRAVPYDQWMDNLTITDSDDIVWTGADSYDQLKATQDETIDETLASISIVVTEDNLDELEETYAEDAPELWHALEEFHHLLYETYAEELEDAIGYVSISQQQAGLVRIYLLMTWDNIDEETGEPIRDLDGKIVYIHQESEWHEH
ncbi:MAG: cytochrome bc complex cytochrome b subunit [Chloroflexi bacterium]|nr:cytochrome bc complex cytochrome b subunit [Chloroflexota bacterium]